MLFHTVTFFAFFALVLLLYWGLGSKRIRAQNILLLVSSYVFYGWWDWRFCGLIALSSLIDFIVGKQLGSALKEGHRKALLFVSLGANLGMLLVFKYFNFFIDSLNSALSLAEGTTSFTTLSVILPVGISFYTFQTLSYTIDIYRRKLEPCKDPIDFFTYVAFFPQLVAGPIERASHLLPQFARERRLSQADFSSACYLIVWGFFKKLVIADTCGAYADTVFNHYGSASAGDLVAGSVFFAFQIYGDFSGYSSIARGISRLLGFDLMINFSYPYFSRNVGEFWRRWHISLSTWFRDYLYIPLGGSKVSKQLAVRNIIIVFLVSGFWHGANWTFIVWGAIHVLMYLPSFLRSSNRRFLDNQTSIVNPREVAGALFTFAIVCVAWVFFRSDTIGQAAGYLQHLVINFGRPSLFYYSTAGVWLLLLLFMTIEYFSQGEETIFIARLRNPALRRIALTVMTLTIFCFGQVHENESFIYFQF